ncbi:hypothetical protein [Mycolicibacterium fortuitum]|uniref:hypothetical protein n=1 Tax=Mycolicibacterium fortuitum TaxID=1766 RepID=UPI0007EB6A52|nr:hypothetical protein [Mycolicibacterium fortuitum]NOQ58432.1 hypothetical protein [Mycolicibacterium fortuitum]OBB39993.1 hypothetical protein A5763_04350 [Mycolicibacterium fortuitum]
MIAHEVAEATPAHDTPTTAEVVAHSISELEALLTRPRAAGESILVRLEGPAAAQILGEAGAVTVSAAVTEEVAR